ncbi:MAG: hypothetical protein HY744_07655 [Deltaproteobacteria bacterium]|nr:hypothetical protein [Deltaproteobacteria bacterium]
MLEAAALVNTGYEASSPDCSLPRAAAERLGLWPAPATASAMAVRGYGGRVAVLKVPEAVRVRVLAAGRVGPEVRAGALIAETDDEIVLSDALSQELHVHPVRPKTGTWRFVDEPGERPGESPEIW